MSGKQFSIHRPGGSRGHTVLKLVFLLVGLSLIYLGLIATSQREDKSHLKESAAVQAIGTVKHIRFVGGLGMRTQVDTDR